MTRTIARNGIIREKEYETRAGAPMKPMNQPPRDNEGEREGEKERKSE